MLPLFIRHVQDASTSTGVQLALETNQIHTIYFGQPVPVQVNSVHVSGPEPVHVTWQKGVLHVPVTL